jgi:hypothetical protein
MNEPPWSRFDDLLSRYLDDRLLPDEQNELLKFLADPARARQFLELAKLDAELAGLLAAPVPDEVMAQLVVSNLGPAPEAAPGKLRLRPVSARRENVPPLDEIPVPVQRRTEMRPRTNPARRRWRFAAVLGLVVVAASFPAVFRPAPELVVEAVAGDVRLIRNGQPISVRQGSAWRKSDRLETGAQSSVSIRYKDGTQVVFGANSQAASHSGRRDGYRLQIDQGTLSVQAADVLRKQPLRFASIHAEAMVWGTVLELEVASGQTRLHVREGQVQFRRRSDRAEVMVTAGHFAVASRHVEFKPQPIERHLPHGHHGRF